MNIPLDVLKIVASYLVKPKMKLLDWVLLDKIDWGGIIIKSKCYPFIRTKYRQN